MKTIEIKKLFFLLCFLFFPFESRSQDNSTKGNELQLTSHIAIGETWSDNLSLRTGNGDSGFLTEITPGLRLTSNSRRLKGYIDYSLHQYIYSGESKNNSLQNSLQANISAELLDNFAFLDLASSISQQTISAFGIQSTTPGLNNANKTEVSTTSVSPYIRGKFLFLTNYEVKYSLTSSHSKSSDVSNSTQQLISYRLSGPNASNRLSWNAYLSRKNNNQNNNVVDSSENTAKFAINYIYANDLSFSSSIGRESGNITSVNNDGFISKGIGVNWNLSPVTKISGEIEKKYLGNMHKLIFEHRTAKTSWVINDRKEAIAGNGVNASASSNNIYLLLFNQFSTVEPDPVKRAQLVQNFMLASGLTTSLVNNGYLTSATTIQRTQDISFALLGLRDTVAFSINKNTGQKPVGYTGINDDFSNAGQINQTGFSISVSHKLNTDSSLISQFSIQKNSDDISSQNSKTKSYNLNYIQRLSRDFSSNIGVRHTDSSGINSYKENAITGLLTMQF